LCFPLQQHYFLKTIRPCVNATTETASRQNRHNRQTLLQQSAETAEEPIAAIPRAELLRGGSLHLPEGGLHHGYSNH